jgi:hypothetical protein
MINRIMCGCLTLALAATCLGQAADTPKPAQDGELQLKRQRVGALRDQILLQLPGEIKAADEPALRAFLRLRLVTFIWGRKNAPAELTGFAEGVASEALADLDQHKSEIPPRLGWLPRDFLAQLQMHAPALAARLAEKYGLNQSASADQLGDALSRLNSKGGAGSAVELVRTGLRGGRDPGFKMMFFLTELDQKRPDEVPRLLSEILDAAERTPGSISLDTFHWLSDFYLREQTPAGLKTRFLAYVVASTKDAYTWTDEALISQAYDLLSGLLPAIERLAPSLHQQALEQALAIKAHTQSARTEQEAMKAIMDKVGQSADPLDALASEAESPENKAYRNSLLAQAAQTALEKGRFELAVELVGKLEAEGGDANLGPWRDQFLGDVVKAALGKKDADSAEKAAARIESPFRRAASLREIAAHLYDVNNTLRAQQTLDEALKLIASADDGAAKAIAYLEASTTHPKVDAVKVSEIVAAATKVIDNIPSPGAFERPGSAARVKYVNDLYSLAWTTIPTFRALAQRDETEALSAVEKIRRRDIRAAAKFGAFVGLGELNVPAQPPAK